MPLGCILIALLQTGILPLQPSKLASRNQAPFANNSPARLYDPHQLAGNYLASLAQISLFRRRDSADLIEGRCSPAHWRSPTRRVVPLARQPGIEESKTGGVESGDESAKGSISYSNSGVSPLLSAVRTDSSEALITISRFSTAPNNVPWPTPPNFPSRSVLKRPQPPLEPPPQKPIWIRDWRNHEIHANRAYTHLSKK